MVAPARKRATYEDVLAAPEDMTGKRRARGAR
jgi:hypothetical protein